tara:strand:- start:1167 stop:1391 length:225 start_codon:yes stop_codon:yes gene_type:complete
MKKNELIIKNTISKIIKINPKKLTNKLKVGDVSNWDSLAQINIYLNLKKKFNKEISIEKLSKIRSIKDWIKLFS